MHEARELVLYADNDSRLYHSSFKPIVANLRKKVAKGAYNPTLARKLWLYHAERAAKSYAKEYGGTWHKLFPMSARMAAASEWEARARRAHPNDDGYIGITSHDRSRKRARASRDYTAKRGSYGGMCLCPCEGKQAAPMATYDPEDPYYQGDRTRRRRRRTVRRSRKGARR